MAALTDKQKATIIEKIKRSRLMSTDGQEVVPQVQHIGMAGANLNMGGVHIAGDVITSNPSSAPVLVRAGSILRLKVSTAVYIAFGPDSAAAPMNGTIDATTTPAVMIDETQDGGWWLIVATDDFVKMSSNPTRFEVIDSR